VIQVEEHGNQYGWNRCICPDCKCQFVFNHLDFRIWSIPDSITRIVECPECGRDIKEDDWYFKARGD